MREPRLGDIIDDYCIKCKRIMNHAVVSLLNGEPAKVRCRTCHNDHDYRHEQPPPPKVDARKTGAVNEVRGKVVPGSLIGAAVAEPFLADPAEDILSEDEPVEEIFAVDDPVEALDEEVQAPPAEIAEAKPKKAKPAAKPAPKAKTRPKTASKGRK